MVAVLGSVVEARAKRRVRVVLGVRWRNEAAAEIVEQRAPVPGAHLPGAHAAHRSLLRLAVRDALLEKSARMRDSGTDKGSMELYTVLEIGVARKQEQRVHTSDRPQPQAVAPERCARLCIRGRST